MEKKIQARRAIPREKRKLAYTHEFKRFVRANPGIIRIVSEAIRSKEPEVRIGGIRIKQLENFGRVRVCWRVDVGEKSFFVKGKYDEKHSGSKQFLALRKLEELLSQREWKQKFPHVEVIKYHFGFDYKGEHFIATDFYELKLLTYAQLLEKEMPVKLLKEFYDFSDQAEKAGYYDIHTSNAFYDPARNKIIVFDSPSSFV